MFGCHVYCFPWDLLDEGVDRVLDRAQNEMGATGLTLVVLGDEIEQFRPHPAVTPRIYRTAGGVYFRPQAGCYSASRLKPPRWEQHHDRDLVSEVSRHCADRRLDLRLSIAPFQAQRLVREYPQIACKNLFGIASRSAVCPSNPDVQAYMAAVCRDLSAYDDCSAIVLDDVQWPAATDLTPYLDATAMIGGDVSDLLSTCYCESCLQAAAAVDVDAQAARRAAQELLEQLCREAHHTPPAVAELLAAQPAWTRMQQWSVKVLSGVLETLKQASTKALMVNFQDAARAFVDMGLARSVLELADGIIIDLHDIEQLLDHLSQEHPAIPSLTPADIGRMELLLRMDEGVVDDAAEVVRQITWAADSGAAGITVTHYGAVLLPHFEWIHRGVRNARRRAAK